MKYLRSALLVCVTACGSFDLGHIPPGSTNTKAMVLSDPDASGAAAWQGPFLRKVGRQPLPNSPNPFTLIWPADAIEVAFSGTQVSLEVANQLPHQQSRLGFFLDGIELQESTIPAADVFFTLTAPKAGPHLLTVAKLTEAGIGQVMVRSVQAPFVPGPGPRAHFIEFVGDSITSGYGDEGNGPNCPAASSGLPAQPQFENTMKAYGPLTARAFNADWSVIAWSGKGVMVNHDNTTLDTIPQLFDRVDPGSPLAKEPFLRQPDLVVIDLMTNDFYALSAANSSIITAVQQQSLVNSYVTFLNHVLSVYPQAHVIVAIGPMLSSMSPRQQNQLALAEMLQAQIVTTVNQSRVLSIEFVPNETEYGCEYHPNTLYQRLMAEQLTAFIQRYLTWSLP